MDKQYNHQDHEQNIYKTWEKADSFATEPDKSKKPFTIIMPPPNANDPLHVGHAMFITIEDILIRYHRMLGDAALWLPGTDHAGIETQFVFEKKLAKTDKSRFDFDRETFYKQVWDYVQENSGVAINQMKRLGASADWSRFKFTLDPDVVNFVLQTFEQLHKNHLVYRGERLVNYCVKCGTGYSELEVEYEEQQTKLYYMKYGRFVLATTRPETKFGDTAVAVNPKDKRYKKYIGQEVEVEGLLGKFKIKVIADEYVDPNFGTGVVKITPYHDFNDFDVWQRHLDEIPAPRRVINYDGRLNEHTGKYQGLKIKEAREVIAKDLEAKGLLVEVKDYTHRVGTCYRCHSVIEPLPLPQFFIKTRPLADAALKALNNGETKILGTGREKILRDWLTNIRDWNISRQIVWGIRIPVWYSTLKNGALEVSFLDNTKKLQRGKLKELLDEYSLEEIEKGLQTLRAPLDAEYVISIEKPGDEYLQETDTFDTWFSSGQWPVVTLKTSNPGDFEYFYPTTVMETGYDILPIWVMRMMLLSIYLTNKSPFEYVYLHGLVRDEQGRKMSKSIGNVINPIDVADKYGADAVRMALVMSTTPGNDSNVGESKIRGMRNFSNKIWNASRYILTKEGEKIESGSFDQEFQEKLTQIVKDITQQLDNLKVGLAAETAYNEFWHWYCDVCIEKNKAGELSDKLLLEGLKTFLKLLHPFVPFVTETIWQQLEEKESELLITSSWPKE